jgi:cyclophilin family peptidyl-prolyl cis-trans isomerase
MTGHWVVPPGKQVNSSDVTWFMNLPYDTKVHYAVVHLHPFAQSLTLRDATSGSDVFKAKAVNPQKGVGLARVDSFENLSGIPMYKDHKYEIVSVYNNPTSENADSMASMFLGVADPEFAAPSPAELSARSINLIDANALVLRTSAGDLAAILSRDQAPQTVLRFARLINAGAFRDAEAKVTDSAIAFTTTLTGDLRKLLEGQTGESGGDFASGAISLCATDADVSFVISTRRPAERDGLCTVFAQIGPGGEVLRAISAAGSARLIRGEILTQSEIGDLQLAPAKRASR